MTSTDAVNRRVNEIMGMLVAYDVSNEEVGMEFAAADISACMISAIEMTDAVRCAHLDIDTKNRILDKMRAAILDEVQMAKLRN